MTTLDRLRVCTGCGTVAPAGRPTCSQCSSSLDSASEVQLVRDGLHCARVIVELRCGACRFWAPIDGLPEDSAIECAHCDLRQAVEPDDWEKLLDTAHAAADMTRSELRQHPRNPYRDLGESRTSTLYEDNHTNPRLRAWISPGHPMCAKCRGPVAVAVEGAGLRVDCPRCVETASLEGTLVYDFSARASHRYAPLRGAIGLEQRIDRLRARHVETNGVIMLRCPGCGGELPAPDADRVSRCSYCPAVSIVPRSGARGLGHEVKPAPWWLVFAGPSGLRRTITAVVAARGMPVADEESGSPTLGGIVALVAVLVGIVVVILVAVVVAIVARH